MAAELNHLRQLEYHDAAVILRRLRALEVEIANLDMDSKVRRLRTPKLKKYREWRDAAIFSYGIGLAQGWKVLYATEERADYDFVARWHADGTDHFCPVQLKELPPVDLNPTVTLEQILRGSSKSTVKSSTVLAVKLNKRDQLDLATVQVPPLPWQQVWYFWCASPDGTTWALYGDVLGTAGQFQFEYPT